MSEEQLIEVVSKALIDSEFRTSLVDEPENTVAGYDLTDEEIQLLKKLNVETLELLSTELEERVSRAGLNISGFISDQGELSQQVNLELQDAMNKQEQALQTMSNIMRNNHDAAIAIINNLK